VKRLGVSLTAAVVGGAVVSLVALDVPVYPVVAPLVVLFGVVGGFRKARPQRNKLIPMAVGCVVVAATTALETRESVVEVDTVYAVGNIVGMGGLCASLLWYLGFFEQREIKREMLDVAALTAGISAGVTAGLTNQWGTFLADAQLLVIAVIGFNALGSCVAGVFLGAELRWNRAARWLLAGVIVTAAGNFAVAMSLSASATQAAVEELSLIGIGLICVGVWERDMRTLEGRRRTTASMQRVVGIAAITTATIGGATALIARDGELVTLAAGMLAVLLAGSRAMIAVRMAWCDSRYKDEAFARERDARERERESLTSLMREDVVQMLVAATWLEDHHHSRTLVVRAEQRIYEILGGMKPQVPMFRDYDVAVHDAIEAFGSTTRWTVTAPEHGAHATVWAVVQEAAVNVAKHAQAAHASVEVQFVARRYLVTVSDNGIGLAATKAGMGWRNLQAAVGASGGVLVVESSNTGGTTVWAEIPA
jgi:hypothetical protein